jgi:hypothetical protein
MLTHSSFPVYPQHSFMMYDVIYNNDESHETNVMFCMMDDVVRVAIESRNILSISNFPN